MTVSGGAPTKEPTDARKWILAPWMWCRCGYGQFYPERCHCPKPDLRRAVPRVRVSP